MAWKIKPGDEVKKGQTIAIVETTKSSVEIESFHDGKVLELVGKEGDEINVGKTIAYFEVASETVIKPELPRIKISPAAKRLAEEHGININQIKGTGTEGSIELNDVKLLLTSNRVEVYSPPKVVNLREAIAKAMSRSKKEIPHYYLRTRVSLDHFMEWIDEKNKKFSPQQRLLVPALLMHAVVLALRNHPEMNGYYMNGKFEQKQSINLGVTISLKGGGVLVPAIMTAETLNLHELNNSFQDLLIRTRESELKNRELTEGTITVTNMGDLGSDEVFGIIFPPQVALVGFGRIHKDVVVDNTSVRPGFVIDVTLSADHRVTDGLLGARFLASIEKYLVDPSFLEEQNEHSGNKISLKRDLSGDRTGDHV